jgi:hypothetical protein
MRVQRYTHCQLFRRGLRKGHLSSMAAYREIVEYQLFLMDRLPRGL